MPQFAVYRNLNPRSRKTYPYLLDVQSDLLSQMSTRVVIPLRPGVDRQVVPISRLTPQVSVNGRQFMAMTPQLAGVTADSYGEQVADLAFERERIVAALDLLFTGI